MGPCTENIIIRIGACKYLFFDSKR